MHGPTWTRVTPHERNKSSDGILRNARTTNNLTNITQVKPSCRPQFLLIFDFKYFYLPPSLKGQHFSQSLLRSRVSSLNLCQLRFTSRNPHKLLHRPSNARPLSWAIFLSAEKTKSSMIAGAASQHLSEVLSHLQNALLLQVKFDAEVKAFIIIRVMFAKHVFASTPRKGLHLQVHAQYCENYCKQKLVRNRANGHGVLIQLGKIFRNMFGILAIPSAHCCRWTVEETSLPWHDVFQHNFCPLGTFIWARFVAASSRKHRASRKSPAIVSSETSAPHESKTMASVPSNKLNMHLPTYAYAKPALKRRSCGFGKLSHFIRSCGFNTSSKPPLSQLPTTQQSKRHMPQHDSRVLDKLVAATASYQCSNVNVTNVYCLSAIDPSGTCCIIRNSHAKLSFVMFIFKSAPLLLVEEMPANTTRWKQTTRKLTKHSHSSTD